MKQNRRLIGSEIGPKHTGPQRVNLGVWLIKRPLSDHKGTQCWPFDWNQRAWGVRVHALSRRGINTPSLHNFSHFSLSLLSLHFSSLSSRTRRKPMPVGNSARWPAHSGAVVGEPSTAPPPRRSQKSFFIFFLLSSSLSSPLPFSHSKNKKG